MTHVEWAMSVKVGPTVQGGFTRCPDNLPMHSDDSLACYGIRTAHVDDASFSSSGCCRVLPNMRPTVTSAQCELLLCRGLPAAQCSWPDAH
jgi:hypothetical protein